MSTLWRRMLHAWAGRLPTRIIHHDGEPLFERAVVWSGRLPIVGEVVVYLHHYLRSDPDRGAHDHPWPWAVALPLAGGYREQRLVGIGRELLFEYFERAAFRFYRLTGFDFHRVIIDEPGRTSWSLFATGPNAKEWGFLRRCGSWIAEDKKSVDQIAYFPFVNGEGSHTKWWRNAPRGRDLKRAAP